MKIGNIRLGLATNSSSSHSIVIVDERIKEATTDYNEISDNYNGEDFILNTDASITNYFAALLYENIRDQVSQEFALSIVKDWTGEYAEPSENSWSEPFNIDHQSVIKLPNSMYSEFTDKQFYLEFLDYVKRTGIILGGNDNEEPDPIYNNITGTEIELPRDNRRTTLYCRKDGDWWTLFNRDTGSKLRLSFEDNPKPLTRSETPELVDVKITDFCDSNCKFCYQGSTKKGMDCELSEVNNLAYELKRLNVFEVALGGGEPTKHREFTKILEEFHRHGIVVNFTTKNYKFLKDDYMVDKVNEYCKGVAFSVSTSFEAMDIRSRIRNSGLKTAVYFHIVEGVVRDSDLKIILDCAEEIDASITVLGYKTTGRGKGYQNKLNNYNLLEKLVELNPYIRIGIDTLFAENNLETINKMGISDRVYYTEEGKHSMYVDLVEKKTGISSYHTDSFKSYDRPELREVFNNYG